MDRNTRIQYRNGGRGWATVTIGSAAPIKVRNNADALAKVSDMAKAKGAKGVNWGACSSVLWVGFSF